jgi:ribosomal protein S18 acetylase RimI-like enzyme
MIETLTSDDAEGIAAAARLLHDFNAEYDEPAPEPAVLAPRLRDLVAGGHVTLLLARDPDDATPVGVAALRVQPSIIGLAAEAYLAELYVVPGRRGQGFGRGLIIEAMRVARELGADYAFLITSEEDRLAQRLYDAAGFRTTEGEGGPRMIAYERDLDR